MKHLSILCLTALLAACVPDAILPDSLYSCPHSPPDHTSDHPKDETFQSLMSSIVASGAPGIQLSVKDSQNRTWHGANGLADLASKVNMQACQLTRVGSTVKTLTAVSIFLLQEEGKLNIQDPISLYLSPEQYSGLANAEKATIEQLLKHSSGIYNYIQNAQFQTASLNNLTKVWQPDELMAYAHGQSPYFERGSDVRYSNTNYVLLGWIIEKVSGKPFYEYFEEKIFEPLRMNSSQFAAEDPVPDRIVRGYVDFYSNFNLINATEYSGWDYFTADGGLLSNAHDLNLFLHALFNGQILSEASVTQMLDWQEPLAEATEGFSTAYGSGIFKIETTFGPAYIHSGDAIGYFASMVHFPNENTTITWTVNGNYGKIDEFTQSKEAMENIFGHVLGK